MAYRAAERNMRSAFLWNGIGSGLSALVTLVPTIVATRLAGVEAGGVVGLAFGVCFVMGTFAGFEVRPFQSIDLKPQFRFSDYFGLRILTCTFMTLLCVVYVFGFKYSGEKAQIVFAICMFKMLDLFADVFEGLFQQKGYLEYSGQSLSLRMVAAVCAYTAVLATTHNTVWAAWAMPIVSLFCIVGYDFWMAVRFVKKLAPTFTFAAIKGILTACFPLFFSAFMNMYILNATKMQVDAVAPALQGYWTPIYMPASVINLFSMFAFRPMLTTLQARWNEGKKRDFLKMIGVLVGWVVLVTAGALLGAYWLGTPLLGLLYQLDLTAYRSTLLVVLVGGGFNALTTVLYYIITVMRRQYFLLLGDGVTFVVTLLITPVFVQRGALTGAALAYLCSMAVRTVCFTLIVLYVLRRQRRKNDAKPECRQLEPNE